MNLKFLLIDAYTANNPLDPAIIYVHCRKKVSDSPVQEIVHHGLAGRYFP